MNFLAKARGLAPLVVIFLCTASSFGQGCAMCNANAKATPKEGQQALNRAVLVLLLPPVGIMVLGAGFAIRYSKKRDREPD